MPKEDKLLSLNEAAEQSGYEVSALRRLAILKRLPAKKVGRQWVITQSQLNKFMSSENYRPKQVGRPRKNPEK